MKNSETSNLAATNINMLRACCVVATLAATTLPAHATTTLSLDFGDGYSVPDFGRAGGSSTMTFANVATGINASITANSIIVVDGLTNPNAITNSARNGSVNGDARIQLPAAQSSVFDLSLWDANVGDGYSSLYNPAESYEWFLTVYDIDSNNKNYDLFTLLSSAEYTLTQATTLTVVEMEQSVSFSGRNDKHTPGWKVPGDDGLVAFVTAQQANASVGLKLVDTPTFTFGYEAALIPGKDLLGGRALLIDGGSLFLSANPLSPVDDPVSFAPVPLPAAGFLLLAGIGVLGGISRSRKARCV